MFHEQKNILRDDRDFNYSIHDETRQWAIDLHREIGRFMWQYHRGLCDEPTRRLFEAQP